MEGFNAADFVQQIKQESDDAKVRLEQQHAEAKERERIAIATAIREAAAKGKREVDIRFEIWSPDEVSALFDNMLHVQKVRGKKFKISW